MAGRDYSRPGDVPALVLAELLRPMVEELGFTTLARRWGGNRERMLRAIVNGEQTAVRFATADRIICDLLDDPGLWFRVPALVRAYRRVR